MTVRTYAVAALALSTAFSGTALAAKPKAPLQSERGQIALPVGETRQGRTGPYPMFEDRPILNGTTQWAFPVDTRTRGKRFSLAFSRGNGMTDISSAGGDAFGIVFYDEDLYEIGTINKTYGGSKPEVGVVPATAAWANVVSDYGLNMPFLYRAG